MKREDIIKKMGQAIFDLDLTAGYDEKAEAALDAFLGEFNADKAIEQAAKDLWNTICIQEYPDGQGKWEELTVIGKSPYYAQVRAVYQQILDLKKG